MTGLVYSDLVAHLTANTSNVFPYITACITPQQVHWLASNPDLPAAFVSPLGKEATDTRVGTFGDYSSMITESFCVVVMISNYGDDLAQVTTDAISLYRQTLRSALTNFHPLPSSRSVKPIEEMSDDLFVFEGSARTCWKFDFQCRYQITTTDCYQPPSTPLVPPVRLNITNTPPAG